MCFFFSMYDLLKKSAKMSGIDDEERVEKMKSRSTEVEKMSPKTASEIAEKIKRSIDNVTIETPIEDAVNRVSESTESWITYRVQTVVNDRVVEARFSSPKKSSHSRSSSEAKKSNEKFFSLSSEGQKRSSSLVLPGSDQELLSSTRIHPSDVPTPERVHSSTENSKVDKKKKNFEKSDEASRNRKSSVESQNRRRTWPSSLELPGPGQKLLSSTTLKKPSTKNSKKIFFENNYDASKNQKSSVESQNRKRTSPSPLELPGPGRKLLSSTILKKPPTKNSKKVSFEKNDEVSKNRESSMESRKRTESSSSSLELPGPGQIVLSSTILKKPPTKSSKTIVGEKSAIVGRRTKSSRNHEIIDRMVESPEKGENDYTRDAEVTREGLLFMDDFADLAKPVYLGPQHPGVSESPKQREKVDIVETTAAELPDHDSRVDVPTTAENRVDDHSIDTSDDNSDLEVRRDDNSKTYLPGWRDEIQLVTRVPRILRRPRPFFHGWSSLLSPVKPRPGQTPSPPKIKFQPYELKKSNQLWDEFVASNPKDFAETNVVQIPTKRKFFKTDRNTLFGLDKNETQEVPTKKRKSSKTSRKKNVESSPASPNMITVHGTIYRRGNGQNEVTSDSDEECAISDENSAGQTHRSQTACDRYERLIQLRSRSRNCRQNRTDESANITIAEDRYRSRSRSRSAEPRRSMIDDRSKDRRRLSKVSEEAVIVVDRHSKRKIDEISRSRSIGKNDRSSKTMRFDDRMENRDEREAVMTEDRQSRREIGEISGSRSVSGNDRRSRRMGFAERMRRCESASCSAITQSVIFHDDRYCNFGAQKDREVDRSMIDKSRSKDRQVDPKINSTDLITEEKRSLTELVHRSISPKDLRSRDLAIDESPSGSSCDDLSIVLDKVDRILLKFDSASKTMSNFESRSNDDLGSKDRSAIDRSKIGEIRNDLGRKERPGGSSRIFGEHDRDLIDIDLRSELKDRDLSATKNYDRALGSSTDHTDLGKPLAIELPQKSTVDSAIYRSRRNLPIIRSEVIYPAGSVGIVRKIVKPSTSTQISR